MMWKPATLFKDVQTCADELGNPLYEPKEVSKIPARFTPYVLKEQAAGGREITVHTRNILLRRTFSAVPDFDFLELEGKKYFNTELQALGRFTLLVLEGVK